MTNKWYSVGDRCFVRFGVGEVRKFIGKWFGYPHLKHGGNNITLGPFEAPSEAQTAVEYWWVRRGHEQNN